MIILRHLIQKQHKIIHGMGHMLHGSLKALFYRVRHFHI
jgi:hypothetical protein